MMPARRGRAVPFDTKGDAVKIDDWLLEILVCPKCHSPVRVDEEASELVCTGADCGLAYPVRDDIPVLLVEEARRPGDNT
jgi:uncharacterized protein YbaR (Trm112 family)